jgi:hypothetical protein
MQISKILKLIRRGPAQSLGSFGLGVEIAGEVDGMSNRAKIIRRCRER